MKNLIAAAAVLLVSTVTANAATFDLTGNGGLASSYNYSVDGIGLTVEGVRFQASGSTSSAQVGQYSNGLGVTSHGGDSHQVDGANRNDMVVFSFDQDVTLESVTFNYVDGNDDFTFFFDGNADGDFTDGADSRYLNTDIPGSSSPSTYTFLSTWIGQTFGIGAYGSGDNFKIKSVSVEPTLSVVPLPAALPLYGAGVAILGFMGWRRKRNAA